MTSRNQASESTQLRVTRVFFSFIVISQLRRPIELNFFTDLLFCAYVEVHQVRRLVFDNNKLADLPKKGQRYKQGQRIKGTIEHFKGTEAPGGMRAIAVVASVKYQTLFHERIAQYLDMNHFNHSSRHRRSCNIRLLGYPIQLNHQRKNRIILQ